VHISLIDIVISITLKFHWFQFRKCRDKRARANPKAIWAR